MRPAKTQISLRFRAADYSLRRLAEEIVDL